MKLLSQPYLLTLDPASEMNILWILPEKVDAYVEFGDTEALGNCVEVQCYEIKGFRKPLEDGTYGERPEGHPEASVWQYIAKIQGLSAGKTVYYRCCYAGEATKIYFFRTAPEMGGDYRFAQISDLQSLPNCNETVHKIGCFHPDFILFSGDATYSCWRLDQWFDLDDTMQDEDARKKAFFPCMQQENGARLMQYAPLFFCPGNHELDYMKCSRGLSFEAAEETWRWSVFMQLFRPLYPKQDWGIDGTRWYSANYADMHIVSLSANRVLHVTQDGKSAWMLLDAIEPGSRQYQWLKEDLENDRSRFKWVIIHFHILNKAWDAKFNFCAPVMDEEGNASYPNDGGQMLIDLFSANHVNAVTYGHSHVYERYFTKGTHYIEAAYMSVTFASKDAQPHPSGLLPVVEDNSKRSFVIFQRKKDGIFATGYYADGQPREFDRYQIADEEGNSVPPISFSEQAK